MRVTIIADASYCPETGKAGYGFWIASSRGKRGGDGVLRGPVANNNAAEMMAILNAFHVGLNTGLVRHGDSILMQTDCQGAIDAFEGIRKALGEQEQELFDWYCKFCRVHNLRVRTKHVKGHSHLNDSRFIVNKICDRKARKQMRKARNSYRIQKIKEYLNDRRAAESSGSTGSSC